MGNVVKTNERICISNPPETNLVENRNHRLCMNFLKKTSCKDKSCAVHTGTGILCSRHTRAIQVYRAKVTLLKQGIRNSKKDYHGGAPNYMCLSCFAVNKPCTCPAIEMATICIGVKFRVPRRSASKRTWIKEIEKFPHLLFWEKYPKDKIGCRYEMNKQKAKQ